MSQKLIAVCTALQNTEVVRFVHKAIGTGYEEFFSDYSEQISYMLDHAFEELAKSQERGIDVGELSKTCHYLIETVFKKGDDSYWYNKIYRHYKQYIKPENDFKQLREYILGKTILEFGCGSGFLALRLIKSGYRVLTADIMDYRLGDARYIPFVTLTSPTQIPLPENSVDTVIAQTVLHHIDHDDLPMVLKALNKIASRLLIQEDVFDLPPSLESQKNLLNQSLLNSFTSLPLDSQFHSLVLLDYFVNVIAMGTPEMNLPFEFKSVVEWGNVLPDDGWQVSDIRLIGFQNQRVHKSCQAWLICDCMT